jgi:hypothetical protein
MINGIMRSMTSADYYGNFILYGDAKGGDKDNSITGKRQ